MAWQEYMVKTMDNAKTKNTILLSEFDRDASILCSSAKSLLHLFSQVVLVPTWIHVLRKQNVKECVVDLLVLFEKLYGNGSANNN